MSDVPQNLEAGGNVFELLADLGPDPLGLLTTKVGVLENKESLKRRIEEASQLNPLEQLERSPPCGFSSTHHGNNIALEDQRNKLRLVVETAQEVWGNS